jgi:RNA polymerase subunit RPABC4/transcription elongation factor Spt4
MENVSVNIGAILQLILAFTGAFSLALWFSLVIWTFRDIRARSRDIFAVLLATLLVLVGFLPGLLLYILLRPRETLAEQYERSLEEEALLQDIEDRRICPSCHEAVEDDFLICPNCSTRLKNQCSNCNRLMKLEWNVCPYCGT